MYVLLHNSRKEATGTVCLGHGLLKKLCWCIGNCSFMLLSFTEHLHRKFTSFLTVDSFNFLIESETAIPVGKEAESGWTQQENMPKRKTDREETTINSSFEVIPVQLDGANRRINNEFEHPIGLLVEENTNIKKDISSADQTCNINIELKRKWLLI